MIEAPYTHSCSTFSPFRWAITRRVLWNGGPVERNVFRSLALPRGWLTQVDWVLDWLFYDSRRCSTTYSGQSIGEGSEIHPLNVVFTLVHVRPSHPANEAPCKHVRMSHSTRSDADEETILIPPKLCGCSTFSFHGLMFFLGPCRRYRSILAPCITCLPVFYRQFHHSIGIGYSCSFFSSPLLSFVH